MRSSAPCRMMAAASLSTTSALRLRLVSASSSVRSAAAVESRSSHKSTGSGLRAFRFRAKARVACTRGPIVPSRLIGSPRTKPVMACSRACRSNSAASSLNFVLRMTVSGEAMVRVTSESASPSVLVPASIPMSADPARIRAANASTASSVAPGSCSPVKSTTLSLPWRSCKTRLPAG